MEGYEAFPNLKSFFLNLSMKHWQVTFCTTSTRFATQSSFREYFPVLDWNNETIRNPFSVNIYELQELRAVGEELIKIYEYCFNISVSENTSKFMGLLKKEFFRIINEGVKLLWHVYAKNHSMPWVRAHIVKCSTNLLNNYYICLCFIAKIHAINLSTPLSLYPSFQNWRFVCNLKLIFFISLNSDLYVSK